MDYDLDEFLEEYDDFTSQVSSANRSLFASRLNQWFHLLDEGDQDIAAHVKALERRVGKKVIPDLVFIENGSNANSGKINLPTNKQDRLAAYFYLFRQFASYPDRLVKFGFTNFYAGRGTDVLNGIVSGLFEPFSSELRRYIQKNFDEPVPEDEQLDPAAGAIPASDRIVHINHNEPEFIEISDILNGIQEDIRGLNDIDPEFRDRALSELSASREILKGQSARIEVLQALLLGCLKWIGAKVADHALGIAISGLITLVTAYFGLS